MLGPDDLRFRVFVIGGNSGAGKTTQARRLGAELGISVLNADDLRVTAEVVTTPETRPELHYFPYDDPEAWGRPVDELVAGYVRVGRAMDAPLSWVVMNHVANRDAGPVIIEGDCVMPSLEREIGELAVSWSSAELAAGIRWAHVVVTDEAVVLERITGRSRGKSDEGDRDLKVNQAKAVAAFGRVISEEAASLGHRVIDGASPSVFDELMKIATE